MDDLCRAWQSSQSVFHLYDKDAFVWSKSILCFQKSQMHFFFIWLKTEQLCMCVCVCVREGGIRWKQDLKLEITVSLSWSPELRQPPQTWTSCSTGGQRGGGAGSWSSAHPQFSLSGSLVPPVDEISHKLYHSAVLCPLSFSLKLVKTLETCPPGEVMRSYGNPGTSI